jgi:hypothetical protein
VSGVVRCRVVHSSQRGSPVPPDKKYGSLPRARPRSTCAQQVAYYKELRNWATPGRLSIRSYRASAGETGMGPLAGSTTTAPPIPWEPASDPFPFHLLRPVALLQGAAELGEPRRLSVRGGAVRGRTLEPEGLPSSATRSMGASLGRLLDSPERSARSLFDHTRDL